MSAEALHDRCPRQTPFRDSACPSERPHVTWPGSRHSGPSSAPPPTSGLLPVGSAGVPITLQTFAVMLAGCAPRARCAGSRLRRLGSPSAPWGSPS